MNSDCPITSCPGVGMMCSPVPPRIPVKRWGINPREGTTGRPTFANFELTTTDLEERALRAAIPDSGGDTPRLSLLAERYFTIHGPGVCPLGTVTLWGLERDAPAWPRVDRILTISPDERRVLIDGGWRATQVGCVMSRAASCPAGTIVINRFVNIMARAERHRFVRTEDIDDAMRAGYTFEAIAFCAW
jgi:hypothetical protein